METKSLVKLMTWMEMVDYCLKHPRYKIPSVREAEEMDEQEHDTFWVDESLGDRYVIYNKKDQCFKTTHPLFKQKVVLVKKEGIVR